MRPLILTLAAALMLTHGAGAARAQSVTAPAALTTPDVDDTVLIYVDYVTGLDNLITTIPGPQFRNNITAFAKFNPLFRVPTIVLGEENDYYGTFLPEITANVTHGVHRFNRTGVSGYTPAVAAWLAATGRRTVVIGGISIDNCTLQTVLDLRRAGYTVYVISDVSGSNSALAESDALATMRSAGAVTGGWLTILTSLGRDFADPDYGRGMMGIIQAHWPASTTGTVNDTTPDGHGMQLPRG
ncbi:isochorismatase family protein [Brevundimonas subvibrioides]|uniref:Isochorismatase hydrolase n=1 Tax=Brevundimonas subvibrioides (strain ATCC 15264 / DSM 4735 / LMG 14903 / NBRC 16000 / CB 81) TaxID=633149 RepID=D9QG70_BRESC|nr:isochorismatase family protein [Brevundimonas subvibrioides]ADL02612.1 isochorismatase hydrolase [Brevundimonas subvibrioides ATCC 15264]